MYIADGVVVVKNDYENKCFVFSKKQCLKYDINSDMFFLLEYINQHADLNRKELEDEFDGINNILDYLLTNQIISENQCDNKYCIKEVKDNNFARLFIECTDACNLFCPHCYGEFGNKGCNNLSVESIDELLKKAAELGVYEADITGGEPFMHPGIEFVFELLYKYGMITTLFTNLTLCSEKKLTMIKKYGIKTVVTSIESADESIHDSFRGVRGSFRKTISNIRWLVDNGIEIKVNYVLGNHNIDDAQKNIDFICSLGVCCNIDVTTPEGRATIDKTVLKKALNVLRLYNDNSIALNCGIGKRMIFISSDGTIYPCPSIKEREFSAGNIYEKYDLKGAFESIFSVFKGIKCNDKCKIDKCPGGCRARALHLIGAIDREDPYYCSIYERDNYV